MAYTDEQTQLAIEQINQTSPANDKTMLIKALKSGEDLTFDYSVEITYKSTDYLTILSDEPLTEEQIKARLKTEEEKKKQDDYFNNRVHLERDRDGLYGDLIHSIKTEAYEVTEVEVTNVDYQ